MFLKEWFSIHEVELAVVVVIVVVVAVVVVAAV